MRRFLASVIVMALAAVIIDYTWRLPLYVMGAVTHPKKYSWLPLWARCIQTNHRRLPIAASAIQDDMKLQAHEPLWFYFSPRSGNAIEDNTDLFLTDRNEQYIAHGAWWGKNSAGATPDFPTTDVQIYKRNSEIISTMIDKIEAGKVDEVFSVSGTWPVGRELTVRIERACYRPFQQTFKVIE